MSAGVRPCIPLARFCIFGLNFGGLDIRACRKSQAIEIIVLTGRIATSLRLVGNLK